MADRIKIKTIRIRWKDYKELRQLFPGKYNESLANYFGRLIEWLSLTEVDEQMEARADLRRKYG